MAATSLKAEQLRDAFEIFNRQSGMLEASYRELQGKVAILTRQLRRAQSERLAELEQKERLSQHLSRLLETLPGAILVIDANGVIQECNSEAATLLNRPLVGCAWSNIVQREVSAGGSEDGNILLRDGRWLSLSRRPLADGEGEVLLLADITESRQLSRVRQRRERLSTIGEMTAKFAHQVRTPLASAMLYTAQLDTGSDRQRRAVSKIRARLQDLGRMVNDMLGFAAGTHKCDETVDVNELLADVRLTLEPQLEHGTELRFGVGDTSLRVAGNKDALKGALLNLVTNACQACGAGGIVTLWAHRDGDEIELAVEDNGPGIPEEALPRLFEPFFTTRPQGTGLGLAVVQAVAAAHEGEIRVTSTPSGSTFTLRIPAAEVGIGSNDDD